MLQGFPCEGEERAFALDTGEAFEERAEEGVLEGPVGERGKSTAPLGGALRLHHQFVDARRRVLLHVAVLDLGDHQRHVDVGGANFFAEATRHAELGEVSRGLEAVLIEVRQDLVGDEAGQAEWAARLDRALKNII